MLYKIIVAADPTDRFISPIIRSLLVEAAGRGSMDDWKYIACYLTGRIWSINGFDAAERALRDAGTENERRKHAKGKR